MCVKRDAAVGVVSLFFVLVGAASPPFVSVEGFVCVLCVSSPEMRVTGIWCLLVRQRRDINPILARREKSLETMHTKVRDLAQ